MPTNKDLKIKHLGERTIPSPVRFARTAGGGVDLFSSDRNRVLHNIEFTSGGPRPDMDLYFEEAGPRRKIFFSPSITTAAIVTCGGLCPGLNHVLRSATLHLYYHYGVTRVLGLREGYRGLNPAYGLQPVPLTPQFVENIHKVGGTVLRSSRGPQDPKVMADFLTSQGIDILLCVGGDGTQRGVHTIHEELERRGLPIAVVGIPKTIDNDINYVSQSFGYNTAVEVAHQVITGAHVEAKGSPHGISIVKLMGRAAGFIAAGATIASQEVNFTLVPELPFEMDGPEGFLAHLHHRMLERRHAVIVVAEGAGQHLLQNEPKQFDASGNVMFEDIGAYLRDRIRLYFAERKMEVTVRYIDPSYLVRSTPANTTDAVLSDQYARYAVHAAMAGKTDMLVGQMHGQFIHVPIPLAVSGKRHIEETSELWRAVLSTTGQAQRFVNTR